MHHSRVSHCSSKYIFSGQIFVSILMLILEQNVHLSLGLHTVYHRWPIADIWRIQQRNTLIKVKDIYWNSQNHPIWPAHGSLLIHISFLICNDNPPEKISNASFFIFKKTTLGEEKYPRKMLSRSARHDVLWKTTPKSLLFSGDRLLNIPSSWSLWEFSRHSKER